MCIRDRGELLCPAHRCGEHGVAEPQRVAGEAGRRVYEVRDHVDLGVPEIVPAVARAGDPLRGDTVAIGATAGLRKLEEVPPDRLPHLWLALDLSLIHISEP